MVLTVAGAKVDALGFIGLGVMGEPMCSNLAKQSGLPVFGFDRRAEPLARLQQAGVSACRSIEEIATRCALCFLCLASDKQVAEVCFGEGQLACAGSQTKVIVDCGTTSVAFTREAAARCAELGITWIDAPIARGREGARNGTLSFMVGTERSVFDEVAILLSSMGTDVIFCGSTGSGQVVKILNNKVVLQTVHALAEALAIGRAAGVDGAVLFDALAKGSADCKALHAQGIDSLLPGHFPLDTFPTLYARKDIGHALDLAQAFGIDAGLAAATRALLDRTIDAGYEREYYPIFVRML
jgi:3-hydroxyisobutyrate dehydrogenase-like beta-hydroxyacid dehydrogenase